MNAAEQIEHLARGTVGRLTMASRAYSALQQGLMADLDDHHRTHRTEVQQLRTDLETAADACDNATPRILLPADVAEASPHVTTSNE
ncbi:hypothetical protein ACLQ3C_10935 [Gordonia sp. DT30]|uniref:hypothetical protein n=1 Tax=unclassified Gordonia (in: high G+C Gram-positive bacteria) TaxID=2657482 RepID=UPI003CF98A12